MGEIGLNLTENPVMGVSRGGMGKNETPFIPSPPTAVEGSDGMNGFSFFPFEQFDFRDMEFRYDITATLACVISWIITHSMAYYSSSRRSYEMAIANRIIQNLNNSIGNRSI